MKALAAVARPGTPFALETVDLDEPRADEVRVRVGAVGICHTDLVAAGGHMPLALPAVLGHEGAGIVDAVGTDVTRVSPGERVCISFRSCGTCTNCLRGQVAYCLFMPQLNYAGCRTDGSTSIRQDGVGLGSNFFGQSSFATYAITYERNLVKLAPDVPFEIAGPLGCGIQTGAGAVLRALECQAGTGLLVLGGGTVGLSAVMAARIRGCSPIIVLEPMPARRALALELGATHAWDPAATPDLPGALRAIQPNGVANSLDTTGRPDLQLAAMQCLAPKGVLGLIGVSPPGSPLPGEANRLLALGLTVRGIIEGDSDPAIFIPELIAHWRAGRLPVERLIGTFPLAQINEAIAAQHRGDCVKAVLLTTHADPEGRHQ